MPYTYHESMPPSYRDELPYIGWDESFEELENAIRIHRAHDRDVERIHARLFRRLCLDPSTPLTRLEREAMAFVASVINDCYYCAAAHLQFLRSEIREERHEPLLRLLIERRWSEVEAVDGRLGALLVFTEKLTAHPGQITRRDVERLRAAGLDDSEVHHSVCLIAYFAFVNRIVDGLGVPLDDFFLYNGENMVDVHTAMKLPQPAFVEHPPEGALAMPAFLQENA